MSLITSLDCSYSHKNLRSLPVILYKHTESILIYFTTIVLSVNESKLIIKYTVFSFRWVYIKKKLSEAGINVHGYSSDGDSRLLKAMRIESHLGKKMSDPTFQAWNDIFYAQIDNSVSYIQDLFHIISKIRARLLETSAPMRIGRHKISLTTLRVCVFLFNQLFFYSLIFILFQCLIKDRPDLKKFVKPSDFNNDDKMNVEAGRRLCHPSIINAIEDPGLKCFLGLLSDFINGFEDNKMSILEKCLKVTQSIHII